MSSGMPSTSRIRSSNVTPPMTPALRPKLRRKPLMSFSMAMALPCNSLRAVETSPALLGSSSSHARPEQIDADHLRDAARVVPLALVHRRFEERFRMPGLTADHRADHRQARLRQAAEQPLRPGPAEGPMRASRKAGSLRTPQILGMARNLPFAANLATVIPRARPDQIESFDR
jgi:hypothetical protein